VDWFKTSPSTGFIPNKAEYVLSQDGYQEILLFFPLMKDKLFGLALGKLQAEVSKTPQTVKVDVQVSNG
jgi:hypothetical protein